MSAAMFAQNASPPLEPGIDASQDRTLAYDAYHKGKDLQKCGELTAALKCYAEVLRRTPNFTPTYMQIGIIQIQLGHYKMAESMLRRATILDPGNALTHSWLGEALRCCGQARNGIVCQFRALQLLPEHPLAHLHIGLALRDMGLLDEARASFERALTRGANVDEGIQNRAVWQWAQTEILTGNLSGGLARMEAHWSVVAVRSRRKEIPIWEGESLEDKIILIQTQGSMEDMIQFARFLPILAQSGARIWVDTEALLCEVMTKIDGVECAFPRGDVLPDVDYQYEIMGLPHRLNMDYDMLDKLVPYLAPPPISDIHKLPKFSETPMLRVGIDWGRRGVHGSNGDRLQFLEQLLSLIHIPGLVLYSFQCETVLHPDLILVGATEFVYDLKPFIDNMSTAAGFLQQIDLLISFDSPMVHLAGAMGRPVWLLVPYAPDWRWERTRTDSRWYPTLKLFREQAPGEMGAVLERVSEALRLLVPLDTVHALASAATNIGGSPSGIMDSAFPSKSVVPPAPLSLSALKEEAEQEEVSQEKIDAADANSLAEEIVEETTEMPLERDRAQIMASARIFTDSSSEENSADSSSEEKSKESSDAVGDVLGVLEQFGVDYATLSLPEESGPEESGPEESPSVDDAREAPLALDMTQLTDDREAAIVDFEPTESANSEMIEDPAGTYSESSNFDVIEFETLDLPKEKNTPQETDDVVEETPLTLMPSIPVDSEESSETEIPEASLFSDTDPEDPGIALPSIFSDTEGQARFHMWIRASDLSDPDISELCRQEAEFGGFHYAGRRFFDDHLMPGDLFIDCGAHWGVFSLSAATRWPEAVTVLAFEPDPKNNNRLRHWIAKNDLLDQVEPFLTLPGAGRGEAIKYTGAGSMHALYHMKDQVRPAIETDAMKMALVQLVDLDSLIEQRPDLQNRRIFLRINASGMEAAILAGAQGLLASGRVAALQITRSPWHDITEIADSLNEALNRMTAQNFHHFRFPHEGLGGALIPYIFNDELVTILSLASNFQRWRSYDRPDASFLPAPRVGFAQMNPNQCAAWTQKLMDYQISDGGRWADPNQLCPGADIRAELVLRHLPQQARVLDIGAGAMKLGALLNGHTQSDQLDTNDIGQLTDRNYYFPVDLVARRSDSSIVLDLNQQQYPEGSYDVAVLSNLLELIHDPADLLLHLHSLVPRLILIYPVHEGRLTIEQRREAGWFNDFSDAQLKRLLRHCDWRVEAEESNGKQRLFVCVQNPQ